MEIEQSQVAKLKITDIEDLDPITVFIEDLDTSKGKITIECFGKCWSAFWGGMGERTTAQFVSTVSSSDYIANCLWDHKDEQYEDDMDAVESFVKKKVLELRRETWLEKDAARELYEFPNWTEYKPQHIYDDWHCPDLIFADKDDFEQLELEEFDIPERQTRAYKYLLKIVDAVREALNTLNGSKGE